VIHHLRGALFVCCMLGVQAVAYAQAPGKPVRVLVGFPPGAVSDLLPRALADRMSAQLGQPIVVENRAGAGGRLAAAALKAAAPDGATIMLAPIAITLYPLTHKKLEYDPFADFSPLTQVARFQIALAVGPQVPAKTLAEYVALTKKDPRNGDYASAAAGSLPHFVGVMFGRSTGIEMNHIPYKGTAPAITALLGGEIQALVTTLADLSSYHRAGRLRAIATSGVARSPVLPEVPTFIEQGFQLEADGWYGFFAPARTPPELAARLSRAINEAATSPPGRQRLLDMGLEPTGTSPAQFAAIIQRDFDRWTPVIKASGFTAED